MSQYDRFRKKYFLDDEARAGVVNTPPLARDLRWSWMSEKSVYLAETVFDVDNHPYDIAFNVALQTWPDLLKTVILHELTHMRLGLKYKCPSMTKKQRASKRWRTEMVRLAAMGAPLL